MRYMSQNLNLIDRFLIYHILNSTAECRLKLLVLGIFGLKMFGFSLIEDLCRNMVLCLSKINSSKS